MGSFAQDQTNFFSCGNNQPPWAPLQFPCRQIGPWATAVRLFLQRQLHHRSDFLHPSVHVVQTFQQAKYLLRIVHDDEEYDLYRNKFANTYGPLNHQRSSRNQQQSGKRKAYNNHPNVLAVEDPEMPRTCVQITIDCLVHPSVCPACFAFGLQGRTDAGHLLQLLGYLVLVRTLFVASRQAPVEAYADGQHHQSNNRHRHHHKPGIVEQQQQQTKENLKDCGCAVHNQLGQLLLNGEGIEKAVDQIGQIIPTEDIRTKQRNPVRKLKRRTNKDSLLKQLHNAQLHEVQYACQHNGKKDSRHQQPPRGRKTAAHNLTDERLDAQWEGQRNSSVQCGKDHHAPHVFAVVGQQSREQFKVWRSALAHRQLSG